MTEVNGDCAGWAAVFSHFSLRQPSACVCEMPRSPREISANATLTLLFLICSTKFSDGTEAH